VSEPGSEFDAFLLLSFGGPEAPEHVMPFLENVTRGRGVPKERLLEVAKHYEHLGGVSPINAQNRALLDAVGEALRLSGRPLPLYFGNRNWHPLLADTLRTMRDDGVKRAVVYVTSAYRSYSGCRQYIEDIERAVREVQTRDEVGGVKQSRDEVGGVPTTAPQLVKLPPFSEHPRFIAACAARLREARAAYAEQASAERVEHARIVFTAHSIPSAMAATCAYEADLRKAAERTIASACPGAAWDLVYQSRSGPPSVPWLEPDILDHLRALAASGVQDVIVAPIGFLTDHVEVIWDLDHEAKELAESLGLGFYRSATVGTHPELVAMIAELVQAAAQATPAPCAATCCAYTPRRPQ
jgi:ferrochelatase